MDVDAKSALKPTIDLTGRLTYPQRKLKLQSKDTIEFIVDVASLEWINELSSSLPSVGLYAEVPDGKYDLFSRLYAKDKFGRFGLESNKTAIEIRKGPRKAQ